MWIEHLSALCDCCNFNPPATPAQIAAAEVSLGVWLPEELRSLLLETDGLSVSPPSLCEPGVCFGVVNRLSEIVEENKQFRDLEADRSPEDTRPAFASLLFIASHVNGDFIAYRVQGDRVSDATLLILSHEDWNDCKEIASSLQAWLETALPIMNKLG